jgi:hypothetical protein
MRHDLKRSRDISATINAERGCGNPPGCPEWTPSCFLCGRQVAKKGKCLMVPNVVFAGCSLASGTWPQSSLIAAVVVSTEGLGFLPAPAIDGGEKAR